MIGYGHKGDHFRMAAADALDIIEHGTRDLRGPVHDLKEFIYMMATALKDFPSHKAFSHLGLIPFPAAERLSLLHLNKGKTVFPELYFRVGKTTDWPVDYSVVFCYNAGNRLYAGWWAAQYTQQELTQLFGDTRNEGIMGDAIEAVLGALRALAGYNWHNQVTEYLEWGDIDVILYSLEHSLQIYGQDYRYCMPPLNRKDRKARVSSFRGTDEGVMRWFERLPEPVFRFPSEVTKGELIAERSREGTSREKPSPHFRRKNRFWGTKRRSRKMSIWAKWMRVERACPLPRITAHPRNCMSVKRRRMRACPHPAEWTPVRVKARMTLKWRRNRRPRALASGSLPTVSMGYCLLTDVPCAIHGSTN